MQVFWTGPAAEDLRHIARYIRRDHPTAARKVAATIFAEGNSLDNLPERGRPGRLPGTRELIFPGWPYILVYQVAANAVQILRVYHGAQDWP
jgi:addiction module RelE/StbE family toxin